MKLVAISSSPVKKGNNEYLTSHLSHMYVFYNLDMLPVGCHHSISPMGASAVASRNGFVLFEKDIRQGTAQNKAGLKSGEMLVKRAVHVAKILDRGNRADPKVT